MCQNCGSCCSSNVPLLHSEIIRLKQLIQNQNITPRPKVSDIAIDDVCPFRGDGCCTIYEDRPLICKFYECTGATMTLTQYLQSQGVNSKSIKTMNPYYNMRKLFNSL